MDSTYLNAHDGLLIGGMFFRQHQKVDIFGCLRVTGSEVIKRGIIHAISLDNHFMEIEDVDGLIWQYDYLRLFSIEHVKEDR